MAVRRLTPFAPIWALALGAGACAPPPGAPAPIRTFPTIDEAKACARDALVSVGFLPETLKSPGADAGVVPGEAPTSVGGRLVTPLGNETQIDYARASARLRIGPQGDTTVTVVVSVQTVLVRAGESAETVQPLSSTAVRARDAVQTRCMLGS